MRSRVLPVIMIWVFSCICINAQNVQISISKLNDLSCFNAIPCDGSAVVTIDWNGPEPSGGFTMEWDSGENSKTAHFLCGGWQKMEITYDNNTLVDSVYINRPDPISANYEVSSEACLNDQNGSIKLQEINGGTPPFQFVWNNGLNESSIFNLSAGEYNLEIKDNNNCKSFYSFQINQGLDLGLIVDSLNSNLIVCPNDSTGSIFVEKNPFVDIISYKWLPDVSLEEAGIQLGSDEYLVIAEEKDGCIDTLEIEIMESAKIDINFEYDSIVCHLDSSLLTFHSIEEDYLVFIDDQLLMDSIFLKEGDYDVFVEDAIGCSLDSSLSVISFPETVLLIEDELEILKDSSRQLFIDYKSDVGIDCITWSDTSGLSCLTCLDPFIQGDIPREYYLTIKDLNNCIVEGSFATVLDRGGDYFIPNIFSPNGDNANDDFIIFYEYPIIGVNSFNVFDQYGNIIDSKECKDCVDRFVWNPEASNIYLNPDSYTILVELNHKTGKHIRVARSVVVMK